MMVYTKYSVVVVVVNIALCVAASELCMRVPSSFDVCYRATQNHPISQETAKIGCLKEMFYNYRATPELTEEDRRWFRSLNRNGFGFGGSNRETTFHSTGFRIRKEYRRLTEDERARFHRALNIIYREGVVEKFGKLHALAVTSAHIGAAFLVWHRVMLVYFEDQLRRVDPTVTLPYWASTFDNAMPNPVNSILWSSRFFGNGNGRISTGPFQGWWGYDGIIQRDYGVHPRGRLISFENVTNVLTKCRLGEILIGNLPIPPEAIRCNLEIIHGGPHNWVGADMTNTTTTGFDPVFYMHHAFIDYIWEKFRQHQRIDCGPSVNPETDYPSETGPRAGHGPDDFMVGFEWFRNRDGLADFWTRNVYNYEEEPVCPNCGSPYLFCNFTSYNCESISRRTDYNPGNMFVNQQGFGAGVSQSSQVRNTLEQFEPVTTFIPQNWGRGFVSVPSDGRTRATAALDAERAIARTNRAMANRQIGGGSFRTLSGGINLTSMRSNRNGGFSSSSSGRNTRFNSSSLKPSNSWFRIVN